ncbi:MAG: hypothetical protein ACI9DQ_001603, partial [Glaciecola sp.]
TLYPILKQYNWNAKGHVIYQNYLGIDENPVPLIAYGYDTPENYVFLTKEESVTKKVKTTVVGISALNDRALVNLCARDVSFQNIGPHALTASGDRYSAEMILCDNFLAKAQVLLGTDNILVAIPRRTVIYIAKKEMTEKEKKQFYMLVSYTYQDDSFNYAQITDLIFEFKKSTMKTMYIVKQEVRQEVK